MCLKAFRGVDVEEMAVEDRSAKRRPDTVVTNCKMFLAGYFESPTLLSVTLAPEIAVSLDDVCQNLRFDATPSRLPACRHLTIGFCAICLEDLRPRIYGGVKLESPTHLSDQSHSHRSAESTCPLPK